MGYDLVQNSSENNNNPDKITLSSLLNIMDGVIPLPGRIFCFSTNYPDQLDDAFLRPGKD